MPALPPRRRAPALVACVAPLLSGILSILSIPLILGLTVFAPPASADPSRIVQSNTRFGQLPEQGGTIWSRVGDAPALVLSGDRLFLNDNTPTGRIAYQSLLGEIEATDRVSVLARVQVISNLDGDGALLEISRPGLELVLRMRLDRVDLMERAGREMRWLGSAPVDLSLPHDLRLTKAAAGEDGELEAVAVEIDGVEVLEARPRGGGTLGVGRVLIGSLSYPSFGASIWDWVELRLESTGTGTRVRTESTSVGSLKGRWASPR